PADASSTQASSSARSPGPMSYVYEQLTGKLRDGEGNVIGIGYSGAGDGKNNPKLEHVVDVGPIPQGTYTIVGPPFNSPKHGPFVLHLRPDAATTQRIAGFGRDPDTFLLHGDSVHEPGTASQGCIIQDRMTRTRVAANLPVDNTLQVVSGELNLDEGASA